MADTAKAKGDPTTKDTNVAAIDTRAFLKVVDKAAKGDTKALAEVRAMCKTQPELWDLIHTDIAGAVRDATLKLLTGDDLLVREAINRDLSKMKRDILGTNPSPLEKLLVERICACWVQVQYTEWKYATMLKGGLTLAQGEYYHRQVDRANHRYMAAIRALAQIRRLSAPMVQVNVAEKQINVAAPQMNATPDTAGGIAPPSRPALAAGDATPLAQIVEGAVRREERLTVAQRPTTVATQ